MFRSIADDWEQNHTNKLLTDRSRFSQTINRVDEKLGGDSNQLERNSKLLHHYSIKHIPRLR